MNDDESQLRHEGSTPAEPPAVPGETIWASEPPVSPASRKPAAYAAVIVGLLAMIGGAIFFVRSLASTEGSSSPQAAVRSFLAAVANEDMLGVLERMPTNERELLGSRLRTITTELGRLGILRPDLDLNDLPGLDVEFTNLELRSRELKDGLAAVEIIGGRSTYRVDPATSPLGEFVRDLLPKSAFASIRGSDDLADEEVVFATVKEGDDWYVSFFYTLAESARRSSNLSYPAVGYGVQARGAVSPEKAVDELIRAGFALDLRRVLELLPPDEAGALQDYAPLFLTSAESGAADAREHYRAQIRAIDLTARPAGRDHIVAIQKMSFTVNVEGLGSIDYDGRCATLSGDFFGLDDPERECGSGLEGIAPVPPPALKNAGFTVVERDGLFYVSPLRTALDSLIAALKVMTPQTLEDIKDYFEQFFGFGEGFMPLPPEGIETLAPRT